MAKKIVLLADGTGNGLLVQVSNICRLSYALDMSKKDQLVYYIPGVGTEEFKPLALLDGATGLGVPANVRKLYRFLSWNWEPGAAVYMFGFSRGAFTIRMLVDLISKEGLLPTEINGRRVSHQEMLRNSEDAWRAFCAQDEVRRANIWVFLGLPKLRDAVLGAWKKLRGQPSYADVRAADPARKPDNLDIDFVGLFDTVEAYGVPIEEMREGVHRLVFPIKFGGDHTIWSRVKRVRQALSLDDERRTFHPIRVSLRPGEPQFRIQEVWFAGVHSDVGGGYPDDMTAHCPLLWMIGELQKGASDDPSRALSFHPESLAQFRRTATAYGPLHDSRAGAAVMYRYDPRQVTLADPKGHNYYRPTVHHTVVERLVDGHDDYAPLALGQIREGETEVGPHGADVVMPDGSIVCAIDGPGYAVMQPARYSSIPEILRGDAQALAAAQGAMRSLDAPNREEIEVARDYVWLNRIAYIFFVVLFLVVLALPLLDGAIEDLAEGLGSLAAPLAIPFEWLLGVLGPIGTALSRFVSGSANVLRGMGDTILTFTPSYIYPYVQSALKHPLVTLALALCYLLLRYKTDAYQDAIKYHARRAWNVRETRKMGANLEPNVLSRIVRFLRMSPALGAGRGIGQGMAPAAYAIAFLIIPGALIFNRVGFNYLEGSGRICTASDGTDWVATAPKRFATNDPCWSSGWNVERGGVYRLTIAIDPKKDDPWLDQVMLTDPYGFDGKGLRHTIGAVLRRWPSAAWFQPIARIGDRGDVEWPLIPVDGGGALSPRGRRCSQLPLDYNKTDEHKSFCETHADAKSCLGGGSALGLSDPLPRDEIDAAKMAWSRDSYLLKDGRSCNSPFPRKTFVSEFVARDTGELFLFVNDAAHVTWEGRNQTFYANNTGTATVTLERLPRATATTTANATQ